MQIMKTTGTRKPEIRGIFFNLVLKKDLRRSVGPIVWKMKKYNTESKKKGITHIQQKQER